MKDKKKVIVVGSLILDVAVYTPRFSTPGESVLGNNLVLGAGGKGSNQATSAHRSGAEVIMIGRVGKDFPAEILHAHYVREGMTEKYIKAVDGSETGSAIIEIEPAGQNSIIVVKGANGTLDDAGVREAEEEFRTCDVVLTQLETGISSVEEAKRLAAKYGKPFILNPAPHQPIPETLLDGIDYLTPNETECEFFSGILPVDEATSKAAAEALHRKGVRNVILTLGKMGAYYSGTEGQMLVPTTDLKSVDSTGAGDAFNGALAVALAERMEIGTALRFANCVASISVTRKGSSPSMPAREESEALLESYYHIKLD